MRSQLMAGRSGHASFVLRQNVWSRWRCRRCGNSIPTGLQGKHEQAMYAKNREWYSGSSSSSGRGEWKSQEQEEIKRLRAQSCSASSKEWRRALRSRANRREEEVGVEEGCKMQFEEVQIVRKEEQQKKRAAAATGYRQVCEHGSGLWGQREGGLERSAGRN